jgi:hypothetical protein
MLMIRLKSIQPTSLQRQNYIIYYPEQNYNMPIGTFLFPITHPWGSDGELTAAGILN